MPPFSRLAPLLVLAALAPAAAQDQPPQQTIRRGEGISTAVATITGAAISPLVGVCAIGAWEYYRTPEPQRAKLPFYSSPKFWIPIGILLLLVFLKDTIGSAAPLLKKPLDALEVLLVNKAALVLVAFPVVFHETAKLLGAASIRQLFSAFEPVVHAAESGATGTLASAATATLAVVMVISGLVISAIVWMVWQAFDVLVLLSPFPLLDMLLKAARTAVLALLAGVTLWSREAGMVFSIVIILICFLLAGWAYRLLIFGIVVSWDLLRLLVIRSRTTSRAGEAIRAFTARRQRMVPKRTFGRLSLTPDGRLEFRYRRYPLWPVRTLDLGAASSYEIGRGLLNPFLIKPGEEPGKFRTLLRILPRYTKSEEALRETLGARGVRDIRFGRGFRAFWRWLSEKEPEAAPAA